MDNKMYCEVDSEGMCWPIDYFQDRILGGEEKIHLELQKRGFGSGEMWCRVHSDNVESGSGECGRICKEYKPRNNKSGRCKHLDNTFEGTGRFFELNNKGLKPTNTSGGGK